MRLNSHGLSIVLICAAYAVHAQVPTHQAVIDNQVGTTASVVNGVAVDGDGNMLITGWRTDALDFGGTAHAQGLGAIFVAKFDAQGNELWSKVSGSADQSGNHKGMSVAVDASGNVYNAGWLFGIEAATFDGTTLPAGAFGFVAKYSASGTLLWVKDFTGGVNAIAVDGNGIPFINLGDATIEKLDPATGATTASATGGGDLMNVVYHNIAVDAANNVIAQWGSKITKYDNALNQIWSTPLVKPTLAESFRVSIDAGGDVWATFYAIFGTVTLGGTDYTTFPNGYIYGLSGTTGEVLSCASPGAYKVKKAFHESSGDIYASGDFAFNTPGMVKYDASLVAQWSLTSFDAKDIIRVGEACFVAGGQHSADITLDGTVYARPNTSGQENAIAAYLCAGDVGTPELSPAAPFQVWPNPADDRVFITTDARETVRVFDATGMCVGVSVINGAKGLDVSAWSPGLYTLRTTGGGSARLVVTH